jgi:NADH-quinone oxidoreductase subunit L
MFAVACILPLLSFLISIFIAGRYAWLVSICAPFLMMIAAVCASVLLFQRWNEVPALIRIEWFDIHTSAFSANLLISNQSLLMLFVVSVISFLVHLYSVGYMAGDLHLRRYFAMLGFFTFSMLGIVFSDSLLVIFVFWELVGFSSYLLIGHYMESTAAARASKKAFILNRFGDAGFLIGMMIVWTNTHSFNLSDIISEGAAFEWQTTASLLIFCGVIGKSAQFPLFTWLPDAMEGPTPVSALIHAATMVAAGVYLMARIFPLFTHDALAVVAITGAITSLIGALAALSQYDLKKILAYSTISQLGLMIMAMGMGLVNAALLHLFTHAFFKACLFLCAGVVIHSLHHAQLQAQTHFDAQDIRNMGGLRRKLPVTLTAFLLSGASLAGIPFFSGFLSKEAILTSVWTYNNIISWIVLITMISVSFLTVVYTFRLIWFVFFSEEKAVKSLNIMEAPPVMRAPIILLATCSLWFMVSWNPFDFSGWITPVEHVSAHYWITIFSIVWVMVALALSWWIFRSGNMKSNNLLRNAFYADEAYRILYQRSVVPAANAAGFADKKVIDQIIHLTAYVQVTVAHITAWGDQYLIDGSVHLVARVARSVGSFTRNFQSGKIQHYIFWATFAIIIFIICALN